MKRVRIGIAGIVQGVGFRPFVYHLARRHQLSGWVLNDAGGVVIEAEGAAAALADFVVALNTEAPPLAVIADITVTPLAAQAALLATQQPLTAAEATSLVQRKPLMCLIVPPTLVEMLPPEAAPQRAGAAGKRARV